MTGRAFWNLCLAFQTFLLLFVRYTPPTWAKWVVVPCGWIFTIVRRFAVLSSLRRTHTDHLFFSRSYLMTVIGPMMNTAPFSFYGTSLGEIVLDAFATQLSSFAKTPLTPSSPLSPFTGSLNSRTEFLGMLAHLRLLELQDLVLVRTSIVLTSLGSRRRLAFSY